MLEKVKKGASLSSENNNALINIYPSIEAVVEKRRPAEPLYCIYPENLHKAAAGFLTGFPGKTLFAVKANPHPAVIIELYKAGIRHFDTASLAEIKLVKGLFPDAECYFMAVCKLAGAAKTAFSQYGVRHFVADHLSEVDRLLKFATPETTIHIRMKAFDRASVYELSSKFGADEPEVIAMLKTVADAGVQAGLAFNVGSLCRHPDAYRRAIQAADQVVQKSGVAIVSLDVGGGFPVSYPGLQTAKTEEFFKAIADEVAKAKLPDGCCLMCEPGRALVASGQALLTQIILIKDDLVFLNDGVYGGLNELNISNGNVQFPVKVIASGDKPDKKTRPRSISGPTCDTLDVISTKVDLPVDVKVGDWIEFSLAGAYSNAMATRFNGLYADTWVKIESDHD